MATRSVRGDATGEAGAFGWWPAPAPGGPKRGATSKEHDEKTERRKGEKKIDGSRRAGEEARGFLEAFSSEYTTGAVSQEVHHLRIPVARREKCDHG